MSRPKERRVKPRVPLEGEVSIFKGSDRMACAGLNISSTGVAVLSPSQSSAGLSLRGELSLVDAAKRLPFDGVLVRLEKRDGGYLWAIRFEALESWVIGLVETYLREQLRMLVRARTRSDAREPAAREEGTTNAGQREGSVERSAQSVRSSGQQAAGDDAKIQSRASNGNSIRSLYRSAIDSLSDSAPGSGKKS